MADTQEKVAHTPGPWSASPHSDREMYGGVAFHRVSVHVGEIGSSRGGPGNAIAAVCMGGPGALRSDAASVQANARLIAAAPELLEALKALVCPTSWFDCEDHYCRYCGAENPGLIQHETSCEIAKAEAAIRKAESHE